MTDIISSQSDQLLVSTKVLSRTAELCWQSRINDGSTKGLQGKVTCEHVVTIVHVWRFEVTAGNPRPSNTIYETNIIAELDDDHVIRLVRLFAILVACVGRFQAICLLHGAWWVSTWIIPIIPLPFPRFFTTVVFSVPLWLLMSHYCQYCQYCLFN